MWQGATFILFIQSFYLSNIGSKKNICTETGRGRVQSPGKMGCGRVQECERTDRMAYRCIAEEGGQKKRR